MLEYSGYTVLATSDPHEVIRLAEENVGTIDLLLTDIIIPEMNGNELAKKLLADYPSLGCLFMSGYPAKVITQSGLLQEGVLLIQKPFGIDDLTAEIQKVLKN